MSLHKTGTLVMEDEIIQNGKNDCWAKLVLFPKVFPHHKFVLIVSLLVVIDRYFANSRQTTKW